MAGIPPDVLERSKEILENLEANELTPDEFPRLALRKGKSTYKENPFQVNIFSYADNKLEKELKKIDPNKMTPLEALEQLYKLKELTDRDTKADSE